jgi:hypothetical protein
MYDIMKIVYCGFFKTASRSIGDFINDVAKYTKHTLVIQLIYILTQLIFY